ncbi:hypothetical protein PPERSA_04611 [Pseudocohnilembus persalinus]|uniref:Uncharacterized protein n=1 Tax=Pseudocohnilembus persalinus TaxID=266149 RepID=A0A0V0QP48_PSEPJ|nr:hypothetical protein PPERSA_04611 [Pseudocohnilembus persalinus]|eukprot:KRX03816.1 hypothetical protein PPERSA_04611 [Pseudocohnilembus persalinus]
MQQKQNQSQIHCQKKEHDNCPLAYFQFSDDKNKIFKCMLCILDDPDKENIILIDQLITNPVWQVKNYPPLKNKKLQQQMKENLKIQDSDQDKEWINKLKANINEQIVFQYKKIGDQLFKSLKILEKQTLQQFEKMFSGINITSFFNFNTFKKQIQEYQTNQINLDQLFQNQLKMQKQLEEFEFKYKSFKYDQQKIQNYLENEIQNLKQQLEKKLVAFQLDLEIDSDLIQKLSQNNLILTKSDFPYKDEIKIENKENNTQILKFDCQSIGRPKQVYSQPLDKNKTYHLKIKFNLFNQKQQFLSFNLLGSENKDIQWYGQNYIGMAHYSGARNTIKQFKKGQNFYDFFENDQTVFNIIFNFNQKLLKIYDDENRGEIQAVIDQKQIQGDLLLGFDIYQLIEEKATLCILDFEY